MAIQAIYIVSVRWGNYYCWLFCMDNVYDGVNTIAGHPTWTVQDGVSNIAGSGTVYDRVSLF